MGNTRAAAVRLRLVVMLGVVSLLSDMTYEGARSVSGTVPRLLGAGAVVVAAFRRFGELIGYGLRLVSGYLTERSGRPWCHAPRLPVNSRVPPALPASCS